MADTSVAITQGSGTSIDARTESTNGNYRQVIVIGDPATNDGVAPVDQTAGVKVDLGVDNDVTVTGSVTANAGTNLNTSTLALESGGNLAGAATSLGIIDDWDETDRAKVNIIASQVGVTGGAGAVAANTQRVTLASDDPAVVSLGTLDNAISGAGFNVTQLGGASVPIGAGLEATAVRVTLPTNGTGIVGLAAGTNGIGKLTANSGVDIGDVDVLSIAAGNNNIGDVDVASIAAGDNNIGNVDVVTLPALSSGTNAIGKLLPSNIDVTTNTNHADKYYTNAGAVTDGIIWSPAAGTRWHVTTLYINVSAAATVTLEDDLAGGDVVRWKGEIAANSGVVLTYSPEHPFASGEDAADLIITTTAGNVYVQAVGFEI